MSETCYKIKADIKLVNQIMAHYKGYSLELTNPYMLFRAKVDGCTITIFKTMTVTFQGRKASAEYNNFTEKDDIIDKSLPLKFTTSHLGSDEVGTGDYFGPIVICATFVNKNDMEVLQQLGVKDSKLLSDDKIKQIALELVKIIPYVILQITPDKINELKDEQDNFNYIKAILHNQAIKNLQSKIPNYLNYPVIIDKFCSETKFIEHVKKQYSFAPNLLFYEKAEQISLAVAASSIIARYTFLKNLDDLKEKYHFEFLKGAASAVDKCAKEFIKIYGIDELSKVAKLKFNNTNKILNDEKN